MALRLCIALLLVCFMNSLPAQEYKCGTKTPPNFHQLFLQQNAKVTSFQNYYDCVEKTLLVNIILIADSLYNANGSSIPAGIALLNSHFDSICINFKVCNIDTVYAYKYYRWEDGLDHAEVVTNYCRQNVINVALVGQIITPVGASGYAPMPGGPSSGPQFDMIVIQQGSFAGKTVLHEFGHYFGLPHTFSTGAGVELVNGSNCQTAGDLFCDTPADINPAPINPGCIWAGTNTDPNGDYYAPLLGNIMSYHQGCPLFFTSEQYNRMAFVYKNWRNYLY